MAQSIVVPDIVEPNKNYEYSIGGNSGLQYYWDMGDGSQNQGVAIQHVYDTAGSYSIEVLVVNDKLLLVDEYQTVVTVEERSYDSYAIVLNELLPNPSGPDETEWIEVYNAGAAIVDLQGWLIRDAAGKEYMIDGSVMIPSNGYVVIERADSKIALNNNAERVVLIAPDGVVRDAVEYLDSAQDDVSYARLEGVWEWTRTPTKKSQNVLTVNTTRPVQPEQQSSAKDLRAVELVVEEQEDVSADVIQEAVDVFESVEIVLSELYPAPDGDDRALEFIELYNPHAFEVSLAGWSLTDTKRTYFFTTEVVPANEYLLVERQRSKIALNNTGDTVMLVNPLGDIVDVSTYAQAPNDASWSMYNDMWQWTESVTPEEENYVPYVDEVVLMSEKTTSDEVVSVRSVVQEVYPGMSIAAAKQRAPGTLVTVTGSVAALPGTFAKQVAYIQDESSGMQVYFFHADWPQELELGQVVQVAGELSEAYGEARVKVRQAKDIVLTSEIGGQPEEVLIKQAYEHVGRLVTIAGEVVAYSGSAMTLSDDQFNELIVRTDALSTKFDVREGASLYITGVMRQRGDVIQLYVRSVDDIEEVVSADKQEPMPISARTVTISSDKSGGFFGTFSSAWVLAYSSVGLCIGILVFLLYTTRRHTIRNY